MKTSAFTLNQGRWVGSLNLGEVVRINYRETRVTGRLVHLHLSLQQQTEEEKKKHTIKPFDKLIQAVLNLYIYIYIYIYIKE